VFLFSERFRHITSPLLNAEIFDVLERPALRERIERSSKHLAIEWVTERLDRAEIVEPDASNVSAVTRMTTSCSRAPLRAPSTTS
jgi:hypothetical protein